MAIAALEAVKGLCRATYSHSKDGQNCLVTSAA